MSKQIQGDEMHPFAKFALPLLGLALIWHLIHLSYFRHKSAIGIKLPTNINGILPTSIHPMQLGKKAKNGL